MLNKKMIQQILAFRAWLPLTLFAQLPPASDIFFVEFDKLASSVNLTHRPDYDNQPAFVNNTTLLYTSIREDGQADIYQIDLSTQSHTRLTQTRESEYSPTVMPGGASFSVVRVELDSTQRLWKFPLDGGEPVLILETVKGVGYHAWGGQHVLAIFIVGNPPTLHLADTRTEESEMIVKNIGRALHKIPNQAAFSFVHKITETEWRIKTIAISNREIKPFVQTIKGSEDYAWSPDGKLFLAQGSKLFKSDPATNGDWTLVADFAKAGIKQITRLAVSPNGKRLVFVAME